MASSDVCRSSRDGPWRNPLVHQSTSLVWNDYIQGSRSRQHVCLYSAHLSRPDQSLQFEMLNWNAGSRRPDVAPQRATGGGSWARWNIPDSSASRWPRGLISVKIFATEKRKYQRRQPRTWMSSSIACTKLIPSLGDCLHSSNTSYMLASQIIDLDIVCMIIKSYYCEYEISTC